MKIPKKVKLCGADFQIVFKRKLIDSDGNSLLGLCDVNNCVIFLQTGMESQKRFEVFFHEVLHAIDENMCFGLGEKKVNNLAIEIIRFIKDNKITIS